MKKEKNNFGMRKIAIRSLLVALAMVLSYVESQMPVEAFVPGMKLGLTNLVVMVVLETTAILYYLLILWIAGVFAGIVIGVLSAEVTKRLPKHLEP